MGVDPRVDDKNYGIFIVPVWLVPVCFDWFYIGHNREVEGYKYSYYDVENADERQYTFTYTPNTFSDSLYVTVGTY